MEDNDDPGRLHATHIEQSLRGVVREVVRIAIPGLPEKGDVSDWLEMGGTKALLLAYDKQARERQAKQNNSAEPYGGFWHGDPAVSTEISWAMQGLIPQVGKGFISAQWGLFKTFTALDLAGAFMSGRPFIDYEVIRRGGVVYLAGEGYPTLPLRLQTLLQTKHTELAERAPIRVFNGCPPLLRADAVNELVALLEPVAAEMQARFELPLALVIFDTLASTAGYQEKGDEDDAVIIQRIQNVLTAVSNRLQTFLLVLDHFGKLVDTGTRGSSNKEAGTDLVLALTGNRTIGGEVSNLALGVRKVKEGGPGGWCRSQSA